MIFLYFIFYLYYFWKKIFMEKEMKCWELWKYKQTQTIGRIEGWIKAGFCRQVGDLGLLNRRRLHLNSTKKSIPLTYPPFSEQLQKNISLKKKKGKKKKRGKKERKRKKTAEKILGGGNNFWPTGFIYFCFGFWPVNFHLNCSPGLCDWYVSKDDLLCMGILRKG